MIRLLGKTRSSIKHLVTLIPIFRQVSQDVIPLHQLTPYRKPLYSPHPLNVPVSSMEYDIASLTDEREVLKVFLLEF